MTGPGTTDALIEGGRSLRFEQLPDEVREVARHAVLDCVGCALAGAREPLVELLVRVVRPTATPSPAGDVGGCSLLGRGARAAALDAALINGAAAHALDFDDTHTTMSGHPTAPVLPALLALAEQEGRDGAALLAALVAGIELECRLGLLLGPGRRTVALGGRARARPRAAAPNPPRARCAAPPLCRCLPS